MGDYLFVTLIAILSGALSGVIGTGSSLLLLPLMVSNFGPRVAMPVMAIAAILEISRASRSGGVKSTGAPLWPIACLACQLRR